ncbi:MAG: alpha/beta hydrolase [Betaproteobacteria bacterium]|nr:alpha/beta hydrolase [Betaproteobacteria bacterium]
MSVMHYVQRGAGTPPIVFVHGFTCDHTDWEAQLAAFAPKHRVIACDLRGHGKTPGTPETCSIDTFGADVAALVEELGLNNVVLVGHSLGCRVVLQAAQVIPKRVSGIVLVDGSKLGSGDPETLERSMRAKVEAVGFATFAAGMFEQMFVPGTPIAIKQPIIDRAAKMPTAIGTALFPRTPAWDAKNLDRVLATTKQPLLAVQSTTLNAEGKRVPMAPGLPAPLLDQLRVSTPHAQIETISTVGHFTQIDAPGWVNEKIAAFIATAVK